jgi:hypothetical protein
MSKATPVRIGQIEVGSTGNLVAGMWPVTEVAVTCQKTGFEQIVKSAAEAIEVATKYAVNQENGYVYRGAMPKDFAQSLSHLPRS